MQGSHPFVLCAIRFLIQIQGRYSHFSAFYAASAIVILNGMARTSGHRNRKILPFHCLMPVYNLCSGVAAVNIQLAVDIFGVVFYSVFGNKQQFSNVAVAVA